MLLPLSEPSVLLRGLSLLLSELSLLLRWLRLSVSIRRVTPHQRSRLVVERTAAPLELACYSFPLGLGQVLAELELGADVLDIQADDRHALQIAPIARVVRPDRLMPAFRLELGHHRLQRIRLLFQILDERRRASQQDGLEVGCRRACELRILEVRRDQRIFPGDAEGDLLVCLQALDFSPARLPWK